MKLHVVLTASLVIPRNITGISIRLLLAVAGNNDSDFQYLRGLSFPKPGSSIPGYCLQIMLKEVLLRFTAAFGTKLNHKSWNSI